MAGYTRQSIADIINGADITAPPVNAEFNQITAAFNGATGHSHDGSTGNAPKIDLTTSVSGYLPAVHGGIGGKNNFAATTNPLATDDAGDGYAPGSMWENTTTGRVFICVGNTSNAAVWRELVQVQTANKIIPETTNTVDLGDPSTRFQDLWLAGGLSAFGNGSLGGTLTVTGATTLSSTLGVTGDTTLVNLSATGTSTLTSVDVNSGAIDSTAIGTTTPAAGTFTTLNANTSLVAATADINGGTIDGATIGASTPSTGAFTTISTSGQATLASADINGGSIDGATVGATSHTSGKFTTLQSTGQATLASADINGGAIDGTTIGTTTPSSGAFTTVSASGGVTGDLTGDVTGNVTGNITGAVTGNVTGNLTGNVTSTGSSSFNNVTIDGTLNMNAGTTATITNLTSPTNTNDAATKGYVDTQVSNLVDSAPGTLDTLNELAAALGDDPDFATTVTNSIATKLPLAGGTMTGAIAMSTNKITGAGDPTAAQDVATKAYVDTQDGLQVTKSGDTMSGNLAMGSNKVTGLATPTDANDAASKTYVDGILGSATAASASAAAAATSESNAATSETNASNSASAAATSEANAAASYDNFDDRYLGAKSTAPTVDNDGDALIVGALYFNSTTNIMNVYGSGGWQSAGSAVNGTSDRQTYTATAGQTVFAATYDTGYVDVYLNGVKLIAGTDFTATNGTSITLASGAAVNDVVDIVAYGTFVLADHYTKLQSDARYVEVAGDTMTGGLNVTGGSVGIGTSSPAAELHINQSGGTPEIRLSDGTHAAMFKMDTVAHIGSVTSVGLAFDINSTEEMRLTSTGLGIGTSSPSALLHLESAGPSIKLVDSDNNPDYEIKNGNGSFRIIDTTAGSDRINISSAGNVGIGTSSPPAKLTIAEDLTGPLDATAFRLNASSANDSNTLFGGPVSSGNYSFFQSYKEGTSAGVRALAINPAGGNVGIGTSSPSKKLHVSTTGTYDGILLSNGHAQSAARLQLNNDDSKSLQIDIGGSTQSTYGPYVANTAAIVANSAPLNIGTDSANQVAFYTNLTERIRLDSSGNLLAGRTATINGNINTTSGAQIGSNGLIQASVSGDTALALQRLTTDGDIIQFRKNTTTVGSIGSVDGNSLKIGDGNTNLRFYNPANVIIPCNSSGANQPNVVDLGNSSSTFKDLYLSGGVDFGGAGGSGTSSSNKLDDYEEGSWTPAWTSVTNPSYTVQLGYYTRVGRLVTFHMTLQWSGGTSIGANIGGLPFAVNGAAQNYFMCSTYHDAGITYGSGRTTLVAYPVLSQAYLQLNSNGSAIAGVAPTFATSGVLYATGFYYAA